MGDGQRFFRGRYLTIRDFSIGGTVMKNKDELERIVELLRDGKFVVYRTFEILDESDEAGDLGFSIVSIHETPEEANEVLRREPKGALWDIVSPFDL
jgi:hypothetical protein